MFQMLYTLNGSIVVQSIDRLIDIAFNAVYFESKMGMLHKNVCLYFVIIVSLSNV